MIYHKHYLRVVRVMGLRSWRELLSGISTSPWIQKHSWNNKVYVLEVVGVLYCVFLKYPVRKVGPNLG